MENIRHTISPFLSNEPFKLIVIKKVEILLITYIYFPHVRVMVFNATFNNISVILRQSVLLVEKTGVPATSH